MKDKLKNWLNSALTEKTERAEKTESTQDTIVAEIHETFLTEVDRLLEEASKTNDESTNKEKILDKGERLKNLGFVSSKTSKEAEEEIERILKIKKLNKEKKDLHEAIRYFSVKYPFYKFITEESVQKICKKYGLIYGSVEHYTGDVPDKNLKDLEKFSINKEDKGYYRRTEWGSEEFISYRSYNQYKGWQGDHKDNRWIGKIGESPLEIAGPKSDFNLEGLKLEGFKLSIKREIPDPIVLQPIFYGERKKGYLIITAWGPEANDQQVQNEIMN